MLSTAIAIGLAGLALILAAFAVILSVSTARHTRADTLAKLEESRLTQLETEMTELSDSNAAVRESLRKLRARITMRQHRQNGAGDSEPDWRTDPDGFKRAMRLKHLRG